MKTCGECTYCCKVMGVKELDKPPGEWCKHCERNKGCDIYDARPESCKLFECLWKQEQDLPDEMRPDKTRVVLSVTPDGKSVQVHTDPYRPTSWDIGPTGRLIRNLTYKKGVPVFVLIGDKRKALLPMKPPFRLVGRPER